MLMSLHPFFFVGLLSLIMTLLPGAFILTFVVSNKFFSLTILLAILSFVAKRELENRYLADVGKFTNIATLVGIGLLSGAIGVVVYVLATIFIDIIFIIPTIFFLLLFIVISVSIFPDRNGRLSKRKK